jgi:alpha-tubulin suppressor-like RCC1 family protein
VHVSADEVGVQPQHPVAHGSFQQIAADYGHACALLTKGAVRCWGWNHCGQLGYGNIGNIGDDETPASAGDMPVL